MLRKIVGEDLEQFKKVAEEITGSIHYNGLYKFFYDILRYCNEYSKEYSDETEKKRDIYIGFITRRCFCVAYIFLKILYSEGKCEKIFDNSRLHFLSHGAMRNLSKQIADQIKKDADKNNSTFENYPTMIYVDESVVFGRAINSSLDSLKNAILEKLDIDDNTPESLVISYIENLNRFIKENVTVKIYAARRQMSLLTPEYRSLTIFDHKLEPGSWNEYSNRLAELLVNLDITNAAFIPSVGLMNEWKPDSNNSKSINEQIAEKLKSTNKWIQINTEYRCHKHNTYFYQIKSEDTVKAICSVRLFECSVIHDYRIIPFMFFPEFERDDIKDLEGKMYGKLFDENILDKESSYSIKEELRDISIESRLQVITLYYSVLLLSSFIKESKIIINGSPVSYTSLKSHIDLDKMEWNYFGVNHWDGLLEKIFDFALSLNAEALEKIIQSDLENINTKFENYKSTELDWTNTNNELEFEKSVWLVSKLEDYVFDIAKVLERRCYTRLPGINISFKTVQRLEKDRLQSLQEFIRKFDDNHNSDHSFSIYNYLAVILQMMDNGLLSLVTSTVPVDSGNEKYTHQLRSCEQSLSVLPYRLSVHRPFLGYLEKIAIKYLPKSKQFENSVNEYVELFKKYVDINEDYVGTDYDTEAYIKQNIISYIDYIVSTGQRISYWPSQIHQFYVIDKSKLPDDLPVHLNDNEEYTVRKDLQMYLSDILNGGQIENKAGKLFSIEAGYVRRV